MLNVNLNDDILASILRRSAVLESLEFGRCIDLNNVVKHFYSAPILCLCTDPTQLNRL